MIGIAVAVNLLGIRVLGGVDAWKQWLKADAGYFLTWRMALYAAAAGSWWRLRKRMRQNDTHAEEAPRLLRVEVASILAILLLETSNLLLR
ncbi:hypothetical protein M4R22_05800 [Acidovorax sp. GBBC 3334]|uniref:hypothetical protein n=1 Tax=Acidovorax sp. GBBC 3334 TaxID=2940496 RepID=UPI002302DCA8|nr:hypothetical protein [Acidovorax sp. GBBC 3334]MDA8454269.1 hypothetical protein [Acidovorax sp. GBBC 3334]